MENLNSNNNIKNNFTMENQTPQKHQNNSLEKLSNLPGKEMLLVILQRANIARQNNFLMLTPEEWLWIASEIITDYPNLTLKQLEEIISDGIKGKLNKV